jgi:hypothetical protein
LRPGIGEPATFRRYPIACRDIPITTGSRTTFGSVDHNELMIKSATDFAFRAALLADPRRVLTEQGVAVPADVTVRVVESTRTELVIAIPPAVAENADLDDDALAGVTGGTWLLPLPFPRRSEPNA